MTIDEIEQLEGCDLDAAVAEHIFGAKTERLPVVNFAGDPAGTELYAEGMEPCPRFSESLDEAWKVVLKMADLGYRFEIDELNVATHPYYGVTDTCACFWKTKVDRVYNRYWYTGPVPVAICRAALLALAREASEDAEMFVDEEDDYRA